MSLLSLASAAAVTCALLALPALAADINPVGQWEVSTGESRYRVSTCGKSGKKGKGFGAF